MVRNLANCMPRNPLSLVSAQSSLLLLPPHPQPAHHNRPCYHLLTPSQWMIQTGGSSGLGGSLLCLGWWAVSAPFVVSPGSRRSKTSQAGLPMSLVSRMSLCAGSWPPGTRIAGLCSAVLGLDVTPPVSHAACPNTKSVIQNWLGCSHRAGT